MRVDNWKLIRFYETTQKNYPDLFELYNLADDLSETTNLARKHPEKVRELNAMLDAYFQDTGALLAKPNPAFDSKYQALYP